VIARLIFEQDNSKKRVHRPDKCKLGGLSEYDIRRPHTREQIDR
jgi:hypothetical protein